MIKCCSFAKWSSLPFLIICGSFMCEWTWHEFNKLNEGKKNTSDSVYIWWGKLCKINLSQLSLQKWSTSDGLLFEVYVPFFLKPRIISSEIEISDLRNFHLLKICDVQVSFRPLLSTYLANFCLYLIQSFRMNMFHVYCS